MSKRTELHSDTYVRYERKNRVTGATIQIVDLSSSESEFDVELDADGNISASWATICADHGFIISHETLKSAESWSRAPFEWCDDCKKIAAKKNGAKQS